MKIMDSQKTTANLPRLSRGAIGALAALLLVTLLLGKLLFDELRDGVRQEAQRNIVAVGMLKASQLQDWLEDREADAHMLADDSLFAHEVALWLRSGARDGTRRVRLAARLETLLAQVYHARAIVLYDVSGRILLRAGERVQDEQKMGVEARQVAISGLGKLIDLHRQRDASLPVIMGFMNPLLDGGDCFGAIYMVEDPAQSLFPLIQERVSDSETAETQLVRQDGDQVTFLTQLRYRLEPPLVFTLPLNKVTSTAAGALSGQQGMLEHTRDYRGRPVLAYAAAIQGTPWVLISKLDEDEAYRVVNQVERLAGILLLAVFGMIAVGFVLWRRREQLVADAAVQQERLRADSVQREGEKRLRTFFEHTAMAMVRTSPQGEFIEINDAWCKLFGYDREETVARHLTCEQITHPDDREAERLMTRKMLAGEMESFRQERRYLGKDGKVLWCNVQVSLVRDEQGRPEFIISAIQDITERKQAEQQISFMAYHDKLTGLPNRALLFDRLSQAMSQAKRNGKHVALLFIDLDGFKGINDEYGHEAGDAVLRMAAQRFLACVRGMDTVSRLGGDEFAIVLGNLEEAQMSVSVAEKIIQAFAQGMVLPDGNECHAGASIGISVYPEHGSAMDNLLTAADHAMYESKHGGKNRYTFFKAEAVPDKEAEWIKLENSHLLGVDDIDEQHCNLAYLVNRLNEALKHDEPAEFIALTFDELLVATMHHFDTESRYMTAHHYPEQAKHEAEHAQLVKDVQRFRQEFSEGRELLVLQSIKDWLLGHISYSDRSLADYLKLHGVK